MEIREIVNRLNDIHKEANEYDNAVCYVTSDDNEVIEAAIKKLEQLDCLYKVGLLKDCESCKAETSMIPTQKSVPPMPRKNVSISDDTIKETKTGHWEWVQYDGNPNIGNWHCSECRTIIPHMPEETNNTPSYKWCPNCGVRMIEPQESEET